MKFFCFLFIASFAFSLSAYAEAKTGSLLNGAYVKNIGLFNLNSVAIVIEGISTNSPHQDFSVNVKTDGLQILIQNADQESEGSVYKILRSEDLTFKDAEGSETLSGIKGYSLKNGILKHVLVTQDRIELTTFTPHSAGIRIVSGKRTF